MIEIFFAVYVYCALPDMSGRLNVFLMTQSECAFDNMHARPVLWMPPMEREHLILALSDRIIWNWTRDY